MILGLGPPRDRPVLEHRSDAATAYTSEQNVLEVRTLLMGVTSTVWLPLRGDPYEGRESLFLPASGRAGECTTARAASHSRKSILAQEQNFCRLCQFPGFDNVLVSFHALARRDGLAGCQACWPGRHCCPAPVEPAPAARGAASSEKARAWQRQGHRLQNCAPKTFDILTRQHNEGLRAAPGGLPDPWLRGHQLPLDGA